MATVVEHYESLLAGYYSWLFGGLEKKCQDNKEFFVSHNIKPAADGKAVDLGCGSGFQSIPLAELGFDVTGVDLSRKLLSELETNKGNLPIKTVNDDLTKFDEHIHEPVELVTCMGDTLTHLDSTEDVNKVFRKAYGSLKQGGCLILTYRDMTVEMKGLDRFIPVNSDEKRVFTCFLEYEGSKVIIHDLIYEHINGQWNMSKSSFRKLRISPEWVIGQLEEIGFGIRYSGSDSGFVVLIAEK